MKYRKKPVVIEAIQYNGNNGREIGDWATINGDRNILQSPVLEPSPNNPTGSYLQIVTLEGTMTACVSDWIIKGVQGEFYPCKPDIFEQTYEPDNYCRRGTQYRGASISPSVLGGRYETL